MATAKKTTTKKSSTKTEEKTTKKTAKKTTKKTADKLIKLTYDPLISASVSYTMSLTDSQVKISHGREIIDTVPKIEGLPRLLTVRVGEILEVTQDQFDQLQALGYVESVEQREKRIKFHKTIPKQHPSNVDYNSLENNIDHTLSVRAVTSLYADKLIIVE